MVNVPFVGFGKTAKDRALANSWTVVNDPSSKSCPILLEEPSAYRFHVKRNAGKGVPGTNHAYSTTCDGLVPEAPPMFHRVETSLATGKLPYGSSNGPVASCVMVVFPQWSELPEAVLETKQKLAVTVAPSSMG